MWIFVNALIENPAFDSQTKETLTLKSSAFGSKCELSEDFVKKGESLVVVWLTRCSLQIGNHRQRPQLGEVQTRSDHEKERWIEAFSVCTSFRRVVANFLVSLASSSWRTPTMRVDETPANAH